MYDDILVPYDGSDGAATVVRHASELAHWADATVHLLYVADTNRESLTVVETQVVDSLVETGEAVLDDGAQTLDTLGNEYETTLIQGNPAPAIVEYAAKHDHDLIVMPTHGHEGLSRYLIGSVTEKVVRLSSVPVLTARLDPEERMTFPYERILVPTDGSPTAIQAASHGVALARALDATVHLLSAVDEEGRLLTGGDGSTPTDSDQQAADAIERTVSAIDVPDPDSIVRHVEHGSPVEAILDVVDDDAIHAVVMGTTGRRGTDRILLGSVAEKTVRSAPVPVVTVRTRDD